MGKTAGDESCWIVLGGRQRLEEAGREESSVILSPLRPCTRSFSRALRLAPITLAGESDWIVCYLDSFLKGARKVPDSIPDIPGHSGMNGWRQAIKTKHLSLAGIVIIVGGDSGWVSPY